MKINRFKSEKYCFHLWISVRQIPDSISENSTDWDLESWLFIITYIQIPHIIRFFLFFSWMSKNKELLYKKKLFSIGYSLKFVWRGIIGWKTLETGRGFVEV